MTVSDTMQAKAELRARIRAARAQRRTADAGITAAAVAAGLARSFRAAHNRSRAIAAYLAMPGEPDPAEVCAEVRASGREVLLPVPVPGRALAWALDDGRHGTAAAPVRVPVPLGPQVGVGVAPLFEHQVGVLLIPALAVDRLGRRLGQGGGYYDGLLADLARQPTVKVQVVAIVHDEEVLDAGEIPVEAHDQSVDAALTPTGWLPLKTRQADGPANRANRPDTAAADDG